MDLLNLNTLALGGIAAAVVAGWTQVKNVARQLSSIVVIQATLDSHLSSGLMPYLKVHYSKVPSGLRTYRGLVKQLRDRSWRLVPYRILNSTSVFYRRGSVLVVTINDHAIKVMTIRGMRDLDDILKASCNFENGLTTEVKRDNHTVYKVFGSEKGAWAAMSGRGLEGNQTSSKDAPAPIEGSFGLAGPDPRFDVSFMFTKDETQWTQPSEAFKNLFYEPHILAHVETAKQWLRSSQWYADRGIPWRRGWLLHGPGGTGKSSLALATAKTMGVPIYHYYLNTLSDREFTREWGNMSTPCVALFEDFDAVFDKRTNLTEHKSLSFDTILNTISGVTTVNGVFLMVTTNHINKIDEALGVSVDGSSVSTRPGRIDEVIYLGDAPDNIRRQIGQSILRDWPDLVDDLVVRYRNVTPVQFQEVCIQIAFDKLTTHVPTEDANVSSMYRPLSRPTLVATASEDPVAEQAY